MVSYAPIKPKPLRRRAPMAPRAFEPGNHARRDNALQLLQQLLPALDNLLPDKTHHLHRAIAHLTLLKDSRNNKAYTQAFYQVTRELGFALHLQEPKG